MNLPTLLILTGGVPELNITPLGLGLDLWPRAGPLYITWQVCKVKT